MTDFSDSFSNSASGGANKSEQEQQELQEFIMAATQSAQFNAQIRDFTDLCWDKCISKPSNKLDSRSEVCLDNCVNRFIDISLLVTNRFAQFLQKSG